MHHSLPQTSLHSFRAFFFASRPSFSLAPAPQLELWTRIAPSFCVAALATALSLKSSHSFWTGASWPLQQTAATVLSSDGSAAAAAAAAGRPRPAAACRQENTIQPSWLFPRPIQPVHHAWSAPRGSTTLWLRRYLCTGRALFKVCWLSCATASHASQLTSIARSPCHSLG